MRKYMLNRKCVACFSLWILVFSIFPMHAWAYPSPSVSVYGGLASRDAQIDKILSIFEDPVAAFHLHRVGVDRSLLRLKLAGLTDAEIQGLAERTGAIKAGGSAETVAIIVLLILLVIVAWLYATNQSIEVKKR